MPSKHFLEWLIGFTEGDGCFSIAKRGDLNFIITQSQDNIIVLNTIKHKLGIGTVQKQGKTTYRFIVRKNIEIALIIELFNGNLVLPSRKIQFQRFFEKWVSNQNIVRLKKNNLKKGLDLNSEESKESDLFDEHYKNSKKNMPSLNDLWILGFIEAEACFTVSFLSNNIAFRTRFIVSQKGDCNISVLSSLITLFGVGQIEEHFVKDNYSYIVSSLKNVQKIYYYFDKNIENFQGIKKESYLKWRALNKRLQNKDHLDKEKRASCIEQAKEINKISRK